MGLRAVRRTAGSGMVRGAALRDGRSHVIMPGYFCWSSAENMWKHGRSGEHMGREMFRETGCILRELSGVLK